MNQLILGKCLDVLRTLTSESVDAIVTDPPYGLGQKEPTPEEILAYLNSGKSLDTHGDFMGKDWEIPSVEVWQECYRVIKPGGHLLSFGGTRTFDLISLGIRMAGFESRDTITSFGMLAWIHGQGFPKGLNVSKAVDKIGHAEAAKQWEGWNTALKPAWEPVLVFRKPLQGTVAQNILEHGTGAINIDACRISAAPGKPRARVDECDEASPPLSAGRWPPNLVLVHLPGCEMVGEKRVKGSHSTTGVWGPGATGVVFGKFQGETKVDAGYTLPDGTETVEAWKCQEGCPVKALDEQSGNCGGYGGKIIKSVGTTKGHQGDVYGKESRPTEQLHPCYDDFGSGGASRFFPQFEGQEPPLVPFFYTGKASKREVTLGGRIVNNHPTKKPLALMKWLVRLACSKGGVVLDPYCGSGTTLVAAVEQGSHYIGIERDPDYHKISKDRLALVEEALEGQGPVPPEYWRYGWAWW